MDVASAVVVPVVNVLTNHIKQKLGYLTSYAEHVEHMRNRMQFLEDRSADIERLKRQHPNMPAHVPGWLEDVKNIKEDVDNIPSNNIGCFSVKKKFLAGRNALRLTKVIERLIKDGSEMVSDDTLWREAEGCLGRVNSQNLASTSTSGVSVFNSRVKTFNDALKLLQQDDDTARVIALCGMAGVGKTTLMKQLKEVAEKEKMFNWIADVGIGNTPNLLKIQKEIAVKTGDLPTDTDLMATHLSKRFEVFSERKEKTLVILDDVWEKSKIKLEDIGLASPLPNGVKLLLTSREVKVCQQIAADVDAHSAFKLVEVDVLEEGEAQDFFFRIAGNSAKDDRELNGIGCEIVKKCSCLPFAIKLIAGTLTCSKGDQQKSVWQHTLSSLKKYENNNVLNIVDMSYKNLEREEDKAIFLLCGLFPEDSNIPIEDLIRYAWGSRYAWGLKLLNKVYTMDEARKSIETSVSNLKNAYLLMDGDSHHTDCVKLHDLVLAFVVNTVSKGGEDGCWIIHHEDDFSHWREANSMSQSCKQISLACRGMSEFPTDFKFPDLRVLKLMEGDESLRFPQAFYATMENLQVIAFERMEYPLVPTSSTNLRTLCFDECLLMFDLTCIGNLSNLEVLSFANSGITTIPSTFGNLKMLRLLDVTGCCNLVIDDGVLKSLVKLEELYMIPDDEESCCFTDNNNSELAERSKNLCALEFEFIGNNAHMKNVSCEKLKRFKLSVGCSFTEVRNALGTRQVDTHSYENSLKLITNREELELLKSMINELFRKTDALYLQVNDMNTLPYYSFSNLRLLVVSKCAELTYLFTPSVATNLSKLEYLDISECPNMKAVIHTKDIFEFSKLKYLRLADLPKLLHFCNKVDVIELPRLMELRLEGLQNFTSIYLSNASSSVSSNISRMQSFFHKVDTTPILKELTVKDCGSIEVIFDIDMGCVGEMDKVSSSMLRSIDLRGLGKLREVWRIKDAGNNLIHGFEAVESIQIQDCERFENLITPATTTFDMMRALKQVQIIRCGRESRRNNELAESTNQDQEMNVIPIPRKEVNDGISKVALPSSLLHTFHHLHKLSLNNYKGVEVIFEIMSPNSRESAQIAQQPLILPFLEELKLKDMGRMSHVWKCNWNELLILQKPQSQSSFHNLTTIGMYNCNSIKYLFSPLMMKLLSNLKLIHIGYCDAIEEVISNRDDEDVSINSHTTSSVGMVFPRLKSLELVNLPNFVGFFLGKNEFKWPALEKARLPSYESTSSYRHTTMEWLPWSYHNLIEADMNYNPSGGQSLFSSDKLLQLQKLETVCFEDCEDTEEIFDSQTDAEIPNLRQVDLKALGIKYIWKSKHGTTLKFPNLTRLTIWRCHSLEYVFTCPMVGSLLQLQELHISDCDSMKVIVKGEEEEEECDAIVNATVVFPCLKSLKLDRVWSLQGFCIGKEAFEFPSLDTLEIVWCVQMRVFTKGDLSAPELYAISRWGRKYNIHNGLNSFLNTLYK